MLEKDINSVFNEKNGPFIQKIKEFESKKVWSALDIGLTSDDIISRAKHYIYVIDHKVYLIDEYLNVEESSLTYLQIEPSVLEGFDKITVDSYYAPSFHNVGVSKTTNIKKYAVDFSKYETGYLNWIRAQKDMVLRNQHTYELLLNFFELYIKENYRIIINAYYLEDDYLSLLFDREKNYSYYIHFNAEKEWRNTINKIIDLFRKRNLFSGDKEMYIEDSSFFILNRALLDIAKEYYAKQFIEMYKGYFPNKNELDLDTFIKGYFNIDFIEHLDDKNISDLTCYLYVKTSLLKTPDINDLPDAFYYVKTRLTSYNEDKNIDLFEQQLLNNNRPMTNEEFTVLTIERVDTMDGTEFEVFISKLFKRMGYTVNVTPASGDQGIDIILVKNNIRIGVQVKRYATKISNKAIQEVVGGLKHYNLAKAIVITNNYFTKSATELAESNDVILWDRNILKAKMDEIN